MYCYYGGIDKIAHERGFGPYYDAELRTADRLVGDLIDAVGPGTAVLVTADHGQVHVADRIVHPSAEMLATGRRSSRARVASAGSTPSPGAIGVGRRGGNDGGRRRGLGRHA